MNATTGTEKIDPTEEQSNLAAVSDVEAGIRDFVRNDFANLRRPTSGPPGSIDPVPEQSPEVTVNNVNSLIQRVAGASIRDIESLISELKVCATCSMPKVSVCNVRSPATPSSAKPP